MPELNTASDIDDVLIRIESSHYPTDDLNTLSQVCATDGETWPCDIEVARTLALFARDRGRADRDALTFERELTNVLSRCIVYLGEAIGESLGTSGVSHEKAVEILTSIERLVHEKLGASDIDTPEIPPVAPELADELDRIVGDNRSLTGDDARALLAKLGVDVSQLPDDAELTVSVLNDGGPDA